MSDPRACPMCAGGEMVRSEGRLEQSGDTYLPTTVLSCAICGYARYAAAIGVHWKPDPEPAPVALVANDAQRRAA